MARALDVRSVHRRMGERLRAARQGRGLSLRDLAERLGVSASLISQIETGRANPSVSTLYALVDELDVSLDELLFAERRAGPPGVGRARTAVPSRPGPSGMKVGPRSASRAA